MTCLTNSCGCFVCIIICFWNHCWSINRSPSKIYRRSRPEVFLGKACLKVGPGHRELGPRDPGHTSKFKSGTPGPPSKSKCGTSGPPSRFKSGTPSHFFNEFIFFSENFIVFLLIYFCVFLNKIYTKKISTASNRNQQSTLKTNIMRQLSCYGFQNQFGS